MSTTHQEFMRDSLHTEDALLHSPCDECVKDVENRRHWLGVMAGLAASSCILPSNVMASGAPLQISTAFDESIYHTQNLRSFARQAEKLSNGDLKFDISVNAKLVPLRNILSALSQGTVAIGEIPMAAFISQFPVWGIDTIPYLAQNYDDAVLLWEASKDIVSQGLLARGIRLLYVVPWPEQVIFSRVPLLKAHDLKGLRLWSVYEMARQFGKKMGAKVVEFSIPEVAAAIDNSEIDVVFATSAAGLVVPVWKSLRHCYDVGAWITKNMVCVSESVFQKLPTASQNALLNAAQDAEKSGWRLAQEADGQIRKIMQDNRVMIQPPTSDLRIALNAAGERTGAEWVKSVGMNNSRILFDYYQKKQKN